jgi:hypothetical protein
MQNRKKRGRVLPAPPRAPSSRQRTRGGAAEVRGTGAVLAHPLVSATKTLSIVKPAAAHQRGRFMASF